MKMKKNKSSTTLHITELNELIYVGAKLVKKKKWEPLKKNEEKIKTTMGNSTGNADKKSMKTG